MHNHQMSAVDTITADSATSFWNTIGFMPHGHCFLWRSDILLSHVVSDGIIAISYFSIPLCLFYFVSKKPNLRFHWIFVMFGLFITACGLTHIFSIITFWNPLYGIEGVFKIITALISLATAIVLWRILPQALELRSPEELKKLNDELLSERENLENEIKLRTNKLEETVQKLVSEISRREEVECELLNAKVTAEKSAKFKSQFLANMSHEIRTPLGLILGFTEELASKTFHTKKSKELSQLVQKNGEILNKVISDILDISKIEAGKLEFHLTTVVTANLIEDLYAMFGPKSEVMGLRFEVNCSEEFPRSFKTDELRFKQILINVIGNAFKFTDTGKVQINMSYVDDNIIFDVIDTGRGILQSETQKIFEAFEQNREIAPLYGGTGLGLTLSKTIAQGLKGNLSLIRSEINKGSHFRICIKNQMGVVTELSHYSLNKMHPPDLSRCSILIIDDLEDNLKLLEVILKPTKAKCSYVLSAAEALEKLKHHGYDLILMDLQMPDINGYEAIKLVEKFHVNKSIWAVSAYAMKDDIRSCKEHGFDEHVAKPINRFELYSKLNYWRHKDTAVKIANKIKLTQCNVYPDLELN